MNIEYEKENLNSVWTRGCPSYNMFCTCFCVGWWCTEEQKHKQRRSDNVAAECLWGGWRGGEPADGGWRRQRWMLSALISPSACDYWGGVCECSRLTWCLCRVCSHISPCEWAFFSRRSEAITLDRKCSFPPQADSHYLAVSAVCAWCDFTNLFIFIPRTARRRSLQVRQPSAPQWDSSWVILFMLYCNLFPFMLQTASASLLSLPFVQTARWVSCHGNGMLHLFHLQTFGVFSGQFVWANTLSTLSNLTPNKRKHQPFLCKRYYSGWKTADHPLISSSYVSDGSTGTVNMCDIIRKYIKYKLNSSAKKSFPGKVISLICRI